VVDKGPPTKSQARRNQNIGQKEPLVRVYSRITSKIWLLEMKETSNNKRNSKDPANLKRAKGAGQNIIEQR
jgi:hypothetical protein